MSPFPLSFTTCCMLCGESHTGSGKPLCSTCHGELPWIDSACRSCGLPLPNGASQLHCGECIKDPPPFQQAITPFYYKAPIRQWITGFKHHRQLHSGHLLGQLLLETLREHYLDKPLPEVILPVPLHWQRQLWRGYNQSAELGKQLTKGLGIPCHHALLKRMRRTGSQQGLGREQRQGNLVGAFRISPKKTFTRVAILDDVVTTGSTAREIGGLLHGSGVTEIHLWAIARTPVDKSGA